eukprot:170283-Chlamydomonas_euryale.AAC.1
MCTSTESSGASLLSTVGRVPIFITILWTPRSASGQPAGASSAAHPKYTPCAKPRQVWGVCCVWEGGTGVDRPSTLQWMDGARKPVCQSQWQVKPVCQSQWEIKPVCQSQWE